MKDLCFRLRKSAVWFSPTLSVLLLWVSVNAAGTQFPGESGESHDTGHSTTVHPPIPHPPSLHLSPAAEWVWFVSLNLQGGWRYWQVRDVKAALVLEFRTNGMGVVCVPQTQQAEGGGEERWWYRTSFPVRNPVWTHTFVLLHLWGHLLA